MENQEKRQFQINHIAVWTVVVLQQVISLVWYTFFTTPWLTFIERNEEDVIRSAMFPYFLFVMSSVFLTYMVAWLFTKLEVENGSQGAWLAITFWLGFVFFQVLSINALEMRPYGLALIYGGHSFLAFVATGAILGSWRKYSL